MRKFVVAALAVLTVAFAAASTATAFEGGGRKPSEAPLIAFGQHYTGLLNNHKDDANYEGYREVAIWRLPPVSARDQVTINWHTLPFTHSSEFPICMELVQGVDDFNWGSVMSSTAGSGYYFSCDEDGPTIYSVSGSGTARTSITVQNNDATGTFLEFFSGANQENPASQETFPYDFTVEAPRHFLGLAMKAKSKVHANGAVSGAVTLANGLPAPDGLAFYLTVEWGDNFTASYTASTAGGQVVFPLALPESAVNQGASFVVTHPADGAYQAVSAKLRARVTRAVASAAEIACARATRKAHALARQVKRLKRNARFAHGATKRRLKHRAHQVGRKWRAAKGAAQAACG
jgi:hypothetical protein